MRTADCHPGRRHHARGLCDRCYASWLYRQQPRRTTLPHAGSVRWDILDVLTSFDERMTTSEIVDALPTRTGSNVARALHRLHRQGLIDRRLRPGTRGLVAWWRADRDIWDRLL